MTGLPGLMPALPFVIIRGQHRGTVGPDGRWHPEACVPARVKVHPQNGARGEHVDKGVDLLFGQLPAGADVLGVAHLE
jgi:hypothetical protein